MNHRPVYSAIVIKCHQVPPREIESHRAHLNVFQSARPRKDQLVADRTHLSLTVITMGETHV